MRNKLSQTSKNFITSRLAVQENEEPSSSGRKENNAGQKRESTLRKSDKEEISQGIFLFLVDLKDNCLLKVIITMNWVIIA